LQILYYEAPFLFENITFKLQVSVTTHQLLAVTADRTKVLLKYALILLRSFLKALVTKLALDT